MTHDPLAQFRVDNVTPRDAYGRETNGTRSYELTRYSAAPYQVVGRDKLGRPIEETINIAYSQKWVHPSGTVNNVVMRTGAIFSMHHDAVAYENETTINNLVNGWLPLWCCPYTPQYRGVTGTRFLVDNPDNIEDCGGKPDGCEHVLAIAAERRRITLKNYEDEVASFNAMTKEKARDLLADLSEAFALTRAAATADDEPMAPTRPTPGGKNI